MPCVHHTSLSINKTSDNCFVFFLLGYIATSILLCSMVNFLSEVWWSLHSKQKSAESLLEAPCGLGELWIWTVLYKCSEVQTFGFSISVINWSSSPSLTLKMSCSCHQDFFLRQKKESKNVTLCIKLVDFSFNNWSEIPGSHTVKPADMDQPRLTAKKLNKDFYSWNRQNYHKHYFSTSTEAPSSPSWQTAPQYGMPQLQNITTFVVLKLPGLDTIYINKLKKKATSILKDITISHSMFELLPSIRCVDLLSTYMTACYCQLIAFRSG